MINESQTGKSKGMAFVDLADDKSHFRALKLHHTKLGGCVSD
jgi:hypothetical protein